MQEDAGRGSEYERRIREQTAYRDAKREAKQIKAGEIELHPWVRHALESKERADRGSDGDATAQSETYERNKPRGWPAVLVWGAAALLPTLLLALAIGGGDTPPKSEGPIPVSLWHGLANPVELEQLERAVAALRSDAITLHLVPTDDLQRSLQIALLQSTPPDVAIVDFETAEQLRAGHRLILSAADEAAAFFPLADPAPWSRPPVLVALNTGRSPEESDRILSLARDLSRFLRSGAPSPPAAQP